MQALLIVNPAATTTSARTRDVIARALGSGFKVDMAQTEYRGHAAELADGARSDRVEVVAVLGGDGTVNEVVNGLLRRGTGDDVPHLAVVPGGHTNVFARTLGLAEDPVEATSQLLDAAAEGRSRRIGLGCAGDRWFTFCAGVGFDAEVVARVEEAREEGARSSTGLYVRSIIRRFYAGSERLEAPLTLTLPGQEPYEGLFLVVAQNTYPWTYLRRRPISPSPRASFDRGLDIFALRRSRTAGTLRYALQLVRGGPSGPHGRAVIRADDQAELTVSAGRPVPFQLDGDHLGDLDTLHLRAVPAALSVLA